MWSDGAVHIGFSVVEQALLMSAGRKSKLVCICDLVSSAVNNGVRHDQPDQAD